MAATYLVKSEALGDCKPLSRKILIELPRMRYSGCVVECRICNREVAGSNLGLDYFTPRSTQPSTPPGSVNAPAAAGKAKFLWLISIADERVGVQVKL